MRFKFKIKPFLKRNRWRLVIWTPLALLVLAVGVIVLARGWILASAEGRTYDALDQIPARKVGLVLGCSPRLANGQRNLYFHYRMAAACKLYKSGKVAYLLVSGDNHRRGYDEPTAMKEALVYLGVPAEKIWCDYAGFRTLDSIVRAKEVFQEDRITVISQPFHNQRAIFIGRRKGVDVIGFNAREPLGAESVRTTCREQLARVKAVLDVYLLGRGPKFLGEPIRIGPES